jgi:hypothetical protein
MRLVRLGFLTKQLATNGPVVVDVVTALAPRAPEPWAPPR